MGNISKIRIQNTDYAIKDSRVDNKVDKVSSTDNAVVRFDGSSGVVQNSGVTINDSNHLTAAKLITSGGTSSQFVKGDGSLDSTSYVSSTNAIKNGDYLVSSYVTLTNSIKGRVFDRNSQDTFFAANSRFIVTHKRYNSTDDSFINNLSTDLFKGTFNSYGNTVLDGEYGILYMGNVAEDELSATTSNTNCVFVFPHGKIFLTFYTSMRCGEILEAKGWFRNDTTWRDLTVVANNTLVYEIQVPNVSYLKAIRIKYSGSNLGSEKKTSLSDVAYIRNRDDITERNLITKYPTAQQMYGNLTAPKFITSGGTSSQFVKGDGTLDSTSYAPLASPALTGTPTAPTATAGTNTTQIATTAFVQSAVEKLSGTTTERPTNVSVGDCYFDTDLGKDIYVKGVNDNVVTWVDSNGFSAVPTIGTTTNRPDLFENHDRGFEYFDTNLKTQVYLDYDDNVMVSKTVLNTVKSAYYSNPFLEGDKLYVKITRNQTGNDTITLAFCKTNDGTFEDAIYLDTFDYISSTSLYTSIVSAPDPSVYPYVYNAFTYNSNHSFRWTKRNTNWIPSQSTDNLVTSVSSSSTDDQYPSAKCVYDLVGNIETLLASI